MDPTKQYIYIYIYIAIETKHAIKETTNYNSVGGLKKTEEASGLASIPAS